MAVTAVSAAMIGGLIGRRSLRLAVGMAAVPVVVIGAAVPGLTGVGGMDALSILLGGVAGVALLMVIGRRPSSGGRPGGRHRPSPPRLVSVRSTRRIPDPPLRAGPGVVEVQRRQVWLT